MTLDTIYVARHGFRLNWVNSNWKSETGLPRDPPLAAFGLTQAEELAQHFMSMPEDQRPTAIYSSPYYRCLQTSAPVARALGLPIFVEHGLSEWYSPVVPNSGLHPRPGSAESLKQYFPSIDPSYESIFYPTRKGENVDGLHKRIKEFMDAFIPMINENGKNRRVLLVSHAATVIALCRYFKRDNTFAVRIGCCTLSEARKAGDGGTWELKRSGDGSFMEKGVQRDWGMEDIVISNGEVVEDPGEGAEQREEDFPVGLVRHRSSSNL